MLLWEGILWNDDPEYLKTQVCNLVWVNLSKAEWGTLAPGLAYRTIFPD